MTPADFRRRVEALGTQSSYLGAAREVLVYGRSVNGQARKHGLDVGGLSRLCKRIRDAEICECCGQRIAPWRSSDHYPGSSIGRA